MSRVTTDRAQTVAFNQSRSQTVTLTYGVPQVSVLGLLLFVLNTLDMGSIIIRQGLENHCYADYTQLHFSCKPEDVNTLVSAFIAGIDER